MNDTTRQELAEYWAALGFERYRAAHPDPDPATVAASPDPVQNPAECLEP